MFPTPSIREKEKGKETLSLPSLHKVRQRKRRRSLSSLVKGGRKGTYPSLFRVRKKGGLQESETERKKKKKKFLFTHERRKEGPSTQRKKENCHGEGKKRKEKERKFLFYQHWKGRGEGKMPTHPTSLEKKKK